MVRRRNLGGLLAGVITLVILALWLARPAPAGIGEGATASVAAPSIPGTNVAGSVRRHSVEIRPVPGAPKVATGMTNQQGQAVLASCSACHATTKANRDTRSSSELDQFHQGLRYAHGNLTCLSCHHAEDYDRLRLADGRKIEFIDVMTLCSQCHGPQRRDYDRGLHGGMAGHWDLMRGGRSRNSCVHCHDAHAPDFPLVRPVLPPRDRVSVPKTGKPEGYHP